MHEIILPKLGMAMTEGTICEWQKKVVYLLQHPKKAVQMGCSGKKRISKYSNENVIVAQFESVYKEII